MCQPKKPRIARTPLAAPEPAGFTTPDQMLGMNQSATVSAGREGRNALRIDRGGNTPGEAPVSENDTVSDPKRDAAKAAYDAETAVLNQKDKESQSASKRKQIVKDVLNPAGRDNKIIKRLFKKRKLF